MMRRGTQIMTANRVLATAVRAKVLLLAAALCCAGPASFALADSFAPASLRNEMIENSP